MDSSALSAICVSGYGRSGSTVTMALLGTDPRVAIERAYPHELRVLTYLAKTILLGSGGRPAPQGDQARLCDPEDESVGRPPWLAAPDPLWPTPADCLRSFWTLTSERIRARQPRAAFWAEKTPHWVAPFIRDMIPMRTVHLGRDPRDVFLSVRDFTRRHGARNFGLSENSTLAEQAREVAHALVGFAEAARTDAGRPDAAIVRYEDWITDPATFARRLGDQLGLRLDASRPELSRHLDRHKTSDDPLSSIGRWRRDPLDRPVETALLGPLGDYGELYGYDLPRPTADWRVDPAANQSHDATWVASTDGATATLAGDDAWIELPVTPFDSADVAELWLCLRGECGTVCSVYWTPPGGEFMEPRSLHEPFFPGPYHQVVRFPVARHERWRGPITRLRIDVCNGGAVPGSTVSVRWLRPVPR
jgi:hypothetical protein